LGDEGHPDAAGPAAPHQIFDRPSSALLSLHGPLRGEGVGLIEDQMPRLPILVIEALGNVGHEPRLLAFPEW